MKKNKISFLIMIVLVLIVSIGCSEKKTEKSPEESSTTIKKMNDSNKRSVKSKIDLLCLKYDVESEMLKNDLMEYLYSDLITLLLQDINDDKKIKKMTDEMLHGKVIDTGKIISMSKKYNVPISKISGIVYDYIIWDEVQKRNNSE